MISGQTLRRRQILVSDEMWTRIQEAAAAESEVRGEPVPPEDWILDQVRSALFFISWDDELEDPH